MDLGLTWFLQSTGRFDGQSRQILDYLVSLYPISWLVVVPK
jgi:hypothetical protein